MSTWLAVVLTMVVPGSFEGLSRQTAALIDGWVIGAPASPLAPRGGNMLDMAFALVRADEAMREFLRANHGLPSDSREFIDYWKASAACVLWYQRSLSLFHQGSEELWRALEEGFVQRLQLLQDREQKYLDSLQG